jgi:hypothetical protein
MAIAPTLSQIIQQQQPQPVATESFPIQQQKTENATTVDTVDTIYQNSFFIPHVHEYISLEKLVYLIEETTIVKGNTDNKIGIVKKIESIPKINQKDGHPYYSCFVFIKNWCNNSFAKDIQTRLNNGQSTRIYYKKEDNSPPEYIVLLPNKCCITQMKNPKHMDLVLYLHTDIRLETVHTVMEGLDFGKIKSIDAELHEESKDGNVYNSTNFWKYANTSIWDKKVKFQYNIVNVCFEYWYKTRTAYSFQDELKNSTFVDIPVFDGTIWSFYKTAPKHKSINPYVWKRNAWELHNLNVDLKKKNWYEDEESTDDEDDESTYEDDNNN